MTGASFMLPEEAISIQGPPVRQLWMGAAVAALEGLGRPARILEVGSWAGASCATWGEALARCGLAGSVITCIDPWVSYFSDADVNGENAVYQAMTAWFEEDKVFRLFLHNAREIERRDGVTIVPMRGRSSDVLPTLRPDYFDLVYIDGSHYYRDVVEDLQIARHLVRDGGIVCGDDLEAQMHDVPAQYLQEERLDALDVPGIGMVHPGVTRAVGEVFGPVSVEDGFWFMRRTGEAFEQFAVDSGKAFVPGHFTVSDRYRACHAITHGTSRLPLDLCV